MTRPPRSTATRLWLLGLLALVTAACGTRVSDERIEAASYLDGTDVELADGGTATGGGTIDDSPVSGSDNGTTQTTTATNSGSSSTGGTNSGGEGTAATTPVAAGETAGDGGEAPGVAPGRKATGSEVSIGVLGTFSGPVGQYTKDFATAIQVWARWVNDNGGLNGHRVRVVVGDDGGSPAGFNSRAQQMVEQEKVLAFAFTTLGLAPGGNNAYLDSVGVPTFGTEGGLPTAYTNPYLLTAVPVGDLKADAMLYAFGSIAKARGITKLATLACSDYSLCDNFDREWNNPRKLRANGLEVVYRARPSLTTPDFTSICIDARRAGAEAIINGLDAASVNRLADSCARQGYRPLLVVADMLARPELAANPNQEGSIVGAVQAAWMDDRVPGVVEMQHAFANYAPDLELNGTFAVGWLAARFLQAAAATLPDNPTSADFIAGLANLNGTTLGGLTYPLNFTPGQPSPRRLCFAAAVVKDGDYIPAPGDPLKCA